MDFIGSKAKINSWIFSIISKNIEKSPVFFVDGCAGSGSTSRYFLSRGFDVISNDLLSFSSPMVEGYILPASKVSNAQRCIDEINNSDGERGFFYKNYSAQSGRMYFTDDNAKLIDFCRDYISGIRDSQLKQYLLYCGLEALSRASNTTGVQAAFLKAFKERAKQRFELRCEPRIDFQGKVVTHNIDIVELAEKVGTPGSILYIDPPYNNRQYGPNYHLYETFVRYDEPTLTGKTGLRKDWKTEGKSKFCNRDGLIAVLQKIVACSRFDTIYLSYSTDGIAGIEDISGAFDSEITVHVKPTTRYKSDTDTKRKYNTRPLSELLFEIQKENSS